MRLYTLVFMEQKIGMPHLTPMSGPAGEESFEADDDETALAYVCGRFVQRVKNCARAELSSMALVADASGNKRLIDDSLEHPHFQETYISYNARTKQLEFDFVSTTTGLIPGLYKAQSA